MSGVNIHQIDFYINYLILFSYIYFMYFLFVQAYSVQGNNISKDCGDIGFEDKND